MASTIPSPAAEAPPRALRATRELTRRYLDPRRSWDADRDAELRAHVRDFEACASLYRRAVVKHRLLVGGDAGTPTGFERERRLQALMSGHEDATKASRGSRREAVIAAAIAGLAAVLVFAVAPALVGDDPGPQPRGPDTGGPIVGVGVSGVTDDGGEYEVVAAGSAGLDDWVRFSYTNEREDLGWLFLVGLQPDRAPGERLVWLAPLPDEQQSLPIEIATWRDLPFEIRLAARNRPGPLIVVAVFTREPLRVADVGRALDPAPEARLPSELTSDVRTRLGLGDEAVVQALSFRLVPGSGAEEETTP